MKKIIIISILFLVGCSSIPKDYSPVSNKENETIFKKYDEFHGITFYDHKTFFNDSPIKVYISQKSNLKILRIVFDYFGKDWIFFTNAVIKNSKENKLSFSFKSYEKNTHVTDRGSVSEYIDFKLKDDDAKKLLDMLSGGEIKLRLTGQYYRDYVLDDSKILAMKQIINYYFKKL